MITNLPREQLVLLGRTVSARRMIDQARYTLGQVSVDGPMQSRLGGAFLAEARAAVDSLEAALRERFGARGASVRATAAQGNLVKAARRYRRAFVKEMAAARRRGVDLPLQAAKTGGRMINPGALAQDLERLLSMALPVAGPLADVGIPASFLEEGQEFVRRLRHSEKEQEMAKRTLQRAAVARKRELTGLVHEAIRSIVELARSVHRDDPVAAAEYGFDVLRGTRSAPADTPAPAASPPADAA